MICDKCMKEIPKEDLKRRRRNRMYDVFVIDSPWPKRKGGLRKVRPNQGRSLDYEVLPVSEIFHLLDSKIFSMANTPHTVFMWTVEQFLKDCEREMEQRHYRRHVRLIWNKGNGIAPAFTVRFSHEYLIWYYKPNMTPIEKSVRGMFMSVIHEKGREHSRKPDIAYDLITSLYPSQSKIDVFSREKRKGFDQWGDETTYFLSK